MRELDSSVRERQVAKDDSTIYHSSSSRVNRTKQAWLISYKSVLPCLETSIHRSSRRLDSVDLRVQCYWLCVCGSVSYRNSSVPNRNALYRSRISAVTHFEKDFDTASGTLRLFLLNLLQKERKDIAGLSNARIILHKIMNRAPSSLSPLFNSY